MFKCSECGYLAVRARTSRELREAEGEYRKRGLRIAISEHIPICFAQVRDFREEIIKEKGASNLDSVNITPFISKEIYCDCFIKWLQGLTPKEHREMLDRQWQLDYQAKREKEDKEWREEQRRLDLQWREDQDRKSGKRHRWDLVIIGIVATLLICASTMVAALIERRILFP